MTILVTDGLRLRLGLHLADAVHQGWRNSSERLSLTEELPRNTVTVPPADGSAAEEARPATAEEHEGHKTNEQLLSPDVTGLRRELPVKARCRGLAYLSLAVLTKAGDDPRHELKGHRSKHFGFEDKHDRKWSWENTVHALNIYIYIYVYICICICISLF
jgi:hypothetical protein